MNSVEAGVGLTLKEQILVLNILCVADYSDLVTQSSYQLQELTGRPSAHDIRKISLKSVLERLYMTLCSPTYYCLFELNSKSTKERETVPINTC